jgi:hypothetical protein
MQSGRPLEPPPGLGRPAAQITSAVALAELVKVGLALCGDSRPDQAAPGIASALGAVYEGSVADLRVLPPVFCLGAIHIDRAPRRLRDVRRTKGGVPDEHLKQRDGGNKQFPRDRAIHQWWLLPPRS